MGSSGRETPDPRGSGPRRYCAFAAASVAAFRRQSRHRQSSPSTGIGRRLVSSAHQHGPARLQVNSVPQREQARRREAGFANRFVMNQPNHIRDFHAGFMPSGGMMPQANIRWG
jgi:hypothetical protein